MTLSRTVLCRGVLSLVFCQCAWAAVDAIDCPEVAIRTSSPDPGALIGFSVQLLPGKSLEGFPRGPERDRAASVIINKSNLYWDNITLEQAKYGAYELNYNVALMGFGDRSVEGGQLPLPPPEIMKIRYLGPAHRRTIKGLDMVVRKALVMVDIVTDTESPVQSRIVLGTVGGIASVPIDVPIDGQILIQKSGAACMADFNYAYDISDPTSHNWDECYPQAMYVQYSYKDDVRPPNATERECIHFHCNEPFPQYDCVEALDLFTGRHTAVFNFQRLAWNQTRADLARFNPFENASDAAIRSLSSHLQHLNEVYRYVPHNTAASKEGMVRNAGWAQLLLYDSDDINIGKRDINIGTLPFHFEGLGLPDYPFFRNGSYAYEQLHGHLHFQQYVTSNLVDANGQLWNYTEKLGFCLVGVARYLNTETTPFFHDFWNCTLQGIPAGWYDSYQRGIPGNWKDTTGLPAGRTLFNIHVNKADQLPTGVKQCDATTLAPLIDPVSTVQSCTYSYPDHVPYPWCVDAYRTLSRYTEGEPSHLTPPDSIYFDHHACGLSYVTDRDSYFGRDVEIGDARDSGFALVGDQLRFCSQPGVDQVLLSCQIPNTTAGLADSQIFDPFSIHPDRPLNGLVNTPLVSSEVVRICESSRVLGCGTACRYRDALANVVVSPGEPTLVSFKCPAARDSAETGGAYSLYRGNLMETVSNGIGGTVQCTVVSP